MLFNSKWIIYKTGEYKSADDKYGNPSPYFRQTFKTSGAVKRATLFASALGVYKLYLNGQAVSNDYLSPGWVDYRKKLPFMRYDVTDMMLENNAIGAVLGDGWAVGHLGSEYAFKRCGYSDRIEFTALLRIEYEDGRTEEISTDKTWRASKGAIQRSDIYMGEYVDARCDLGNFSLFDYDDSKWDFADESIFKFSRNLYLDEVKIPPIVTKHTFKPELISKTENSYLYNVGQNISGVLSLTLVGERGARVVLRHGEILSEGALYTENLRKAEATDTYILAGSGTEHFRPLFTFHGFQYAELTVTGKVEICDITAEAMYTDLEPTGEFSSSDYILTKTYQNALWGQRDNFLNVPTDCPQRDERLGWTADTQIFAKSAMWNMNCREFFKKYLADVRDAQLGNGVIPAVAPVPPVGSYAYTGYEAAAGWSEAIAEIPYAHYVMYGDKKVIRDNLPAVKRLLEYYGIESPDGIRRGWGYGDWLSLGSPSDKPAVSTLYYARAAKLAEKMCDIIGDGERDIYAELYERLKNTFRQNFIDEDGKILSDTQSLYVMAYKFGIINKDEAKKNLVRKFKEDNGKLTTGFLGVKFLLPTLCEIGRSDIAYSLVTSTEFPGWGYSIVNGATTIWERWDSYTKEGGIRTGMNSFNHYSFGSCTEWMYEYCLGMQPDESGGFKKMRFAPCFDKSGKVTSANGHYDSPFGKISVSWTKVDGGFEYTVSVPKEIDHSFDFGDMTVVKKEIGEDFVRFTLN